MKQEGEKMQFPLSFWDLSLWLAVTAIILLVTSEFLSPYYGQTNLRINKRRLRTAALAFGILFMLTVVLRIVEIVTSA